MSPQYQDITPWLRANEEAEAEAEAEAVNAADAADDIADIADTDADTDDNDVNTAVMLYWVKHYVTNVRCVLCDQFGIIPVISRPYCICPNGQWLRHAATATTSSAAAAFVAGIV